MKRLLLILITCLIGQLGLYAQNDSLEVTYRLSGLITDAQTGEPVPFVSVHNGPTWNTHADMNGVYSLNLPAGSVKLLFSAVGYKDSSVEVNLSQDLEMNVVLELTNTVLPFLKVT